MLLIMQFLSVVFIHDYWLYNDRQYSSFMLLIMQFLSVVFIHDYWLYNDRQYSSFMIISYTIYDHDF